MMVSCLLAAVESACSYDNIKAAFEKSGISPVSRDRALHSEYAMESNLFSVRENPINNVFLNEDPSALRKLFIYEKKKEPTEEDHVTLTKLMDMIKKFHSSTPFYGKLLSNIPDLLIEQDGVISRINVENIWCHSWLQMLLGIRFMYLITELELLSKSIKVKKLNKDIGFEFS